MACRVGRTEPSLAAAQFNLAVSLWPHFTPKGKVALEGRLNWSRDNAVRMRVPEPKSAEALRRRLASERGTP
jgi:hypothetical protein